MIRTVKGEDKMEIVVIARNKAQAISEAEEYVIAHPHFGDKRNLKKCHRVIREGTEKLYCFMVEQIN